MGFRHLVVVDGNLFVVGMITRSDMNEHHLEHIWHSEVCMYVCMYVFVFVMYVFAECIMMATVANVQY